MKNTLYWIFLITIAVNAQNTEAPSWVDFANSKANGDMRNSVLLDYSFAGYHFSEKDLPDVSGWNTISVLDYGATPDDQNFDDAGIQAAIDAAEAQTMPTVVYFPAGRYKISSDATKDTPIEVNGSHIVLKGAGSGAGGTEIYADKMGDVSKKWNTPWKILIKSVGGNKGKLTDLRKRIYRGDTQIEVVDPSKLQVGMVVVLNQNNAKENVEVNFPDLGTKPVWTMTEEGMRISERHLITAINGNMVTFKNPVNCTVTADRTGANLSRSPLIEEVGVEDILFTSGWKSHPDKYVHHANNIVDYGWRAIEVSGVKNGWIRNVEFRDWVECLRVENSMATTVKDISITGKQGHSSYWAVASTGILFENCKDLVPVGFRNAGGQGHGPGLQLRSTGCVFLNSLMQKHQSIDCHGFQPYGNLMDNLSGGTVSNNGGSEKSNPHSGPDHAFWNFTHISNFNSKRFDFWDLSRRTLHYFAHPKFVGFTAAQGENITFRNEGLNELKGQQAYPQSLFDAQLQLRRYGSYMSASSEKISGLAKYANDENEGTAWESKASASEQWIMLDFGVAKTVSGIVLKEKLDRINEWTLEYWDESEWKIIRSDNEIGAERQVDFNSIDTRKIRFTVVSKLAGSENNSVSLSTFRVSETPLSVEDNQAAFTSVNVYPNPSAGRFTLDFPFSLNNVSIDIYNVQSQLLSSKIYPVASRRALLNLEDKPDGIYFIKVHTDKPVFIKLIKK